MKKWGVLSLLPLIWGCSHMAPVEYLLEEKDYPPLDRNCDSCWGGT